MSRKDAALSILIAALAAAYLFGAARISTGAGTAEVVGPRTFPYLIGGSLLVVSLGWTLARLLRRREISPPASSPPSSSGASNAEPHTTPPTAGPTRRSGTRGEASRSGAARAVARYRHLVMLGTTAMYLVLLGVVGFSISTAAYVAAGVLVVGGHGRYTGARLALPVIFGVAASAGLYLLFDGALNVALPQGPLS